MRIPDLPSRLHWMMPRPAPARRLDRLRQPGRRYAKHLPAPRPARSHHRPPNHPPAAWWHPAPGTSWQIQYTGALDLSFDVQMYDLDLFETSQSVIDELHAAGRRVVCYFSAGSWEDWRPDAGQFPESVLGNELEGWPGERWLDIRQLDVLGPIMAARLDLAAQKGCDGVDPDNVEGYANDSGFPLTAQDQAAYNIWLASPGPQPRAGGRAEK